MTTVNWDVPYEHVVGCLSTKATLNFKKKALDSIKVLIRRNPEKKKEIIEAGAIPLLNSLSFTRNVGSEAREVLWALTQSGPANVENGVYIRNLVAMLDHGNHRDLRHYATNTLGILARDNAECSVKIAEAGAIPPIVEMLGPGNDSYSCAQASSALGNLALNAECCVKIAEAGAIPPLVVMLGPGNDSYSCAKASFALGKLALNAECCVKIAEAGAIPHLVKMLGSPRLCKTAADTLSNLAHDHAENQVKIAEAGAIKHLVAMSIDHQVNALGTLMVLCKNADNCVKIAEAGAIKHLVAILNPENRRVSELRERAAVTLGNLAIHDENKDNIAEAGVFPYLVKMLGPENSPVLRETAARTLGDLSEYNKDKIDEAGAIQHLVKMLGPENSPILRENASTTLRIIAVKNVATRVKIAEAGAIQHLVAGLGHERFSWSMGAILWMLMCDDAVYRAKITEADALMKLVELWSRNSNFDKIATEAFWKLSADNVENGIKIVEAGAIQQLVKMLGSRIFRDDAAMTIMNLSSNADNIRKIVEADAIPHLVAIMESCHWATWTLSNLAMDENIEERVKIAEAGAIPYLVKMLGSEITQIAAYTIMNLSANAKNIRKIVEAGAIPHLVAIMESCHWATSTLSNLTLDSFENRAKLSEAGAIPHLVKLLASGGSEISYEIAAGILCNLARDNEENRVKIVAAGALSHLRGIAGEQLSSALLLDENSDAAIALLELASPPLKKRQRFS